MPTVVTGKNLRLIVSLLTFTLLSGLGNLASSRLAEAAPPPLEVYGNFPKTEEVALSPNGKLIAMVTTVRNQRLLLISEVNGAPLVSSDLKELREGGLQWADDDHLIAYTREVAMHFGQEFVQALLVKVSARKIAPLIPKAPAYVPAIFGRFGFSQVDGHSYGFFGLIPGDDKSESVQQRYPNLCRIDLDSGAFSWIERGDSALPNWVIDATGHVVAESEYRSDKGTWNLYRADSRAQPLLTGRADYGFTVLGMGRSAGTVLVRTRDEEQGVAEVQLSDGHMEQILPDQEILRSYFSPVTHLLQAVQVVGDDDPIIAFDPVLDGHLQSIRKAFAGKYVSLVAVSADLSRVVVKVSGGDVSGTWQMVDFAAKKATPLADAYPDIPDGEVGEVKEIAYPAADGMNIHAILTLPTHRAAHSLPLLVLPHGGPQAVDRPVFNWWAQAFASRGYAVLQPNYRGSEGYGANFRNAGFGEWGHKMQTDVSDGIGYLAHQGIVDPKRVCIAGASYGGYIALTGVTLQHGIYRCAAAYGAISDPDALLKLKQTNLGREYMEAMTRYWASSTTGNAHNPQPAALFAPVKHASQADAPILLVHGAEDAMVPVQQSEAMASALKKAGKPVDFVSIKDATQSLSESAARLQMLKTMVAFVEKYNPPDPAMAQSASR